MFFPAINIFATTCVNGTYSATQSNSGPTLIEELNLPDVNSLDDTLITKFILENKNSQFIFQDPSALARYFISSKIEISSKDNSTAYIDIDHCLALAIKNNQDIAIVNDSNLLKLIVDKHHNLISEFTCHQINMEPTQDMHRYIRFALSMDVPRANIEQYINFSNSSLVTYTR